MSQSTPKIRAGTAKALAQGGDVEIIRDDRLRLAIAVWVSQYDDAALALARLEERQAVASERFAHDLVAGMATDSANGEEYVLERAVRLFGREPAFREGLYLVTNVRQNRIARLNQLLVSTNSLAVALGVPR